MYKILPQKYLKKTFQDQEPSEHDEEDLLQQVEKKENMERERYFRVYSIESQEVDVRFRQREHYYY